MSAADVESERRRVLTMIETLSLKEAKTFLNAGWTTLQMVRLRKFDQGRDVFRLVSRGGLVFDAFTPGKAVANAMLHDLTTFKLLGEGHPDFTQRSPVGSALERTANRIARKASRRSR